MSGGSFAIAALTAGTSFTPELSRPNTSCPVPAIVPSRSHAVPSATAAAIVLRRLSHNATSVTTNATASAAYTQTWNSR